MSVQYQFQLEDARQKKEKAFKKKGSTNILIYLGGVSLFIAIILVLFSILSIGTDTNDSSLLGFSCCFSLSIIFGLTAIILIPIGFIRRHNLNAEIEATDLEIREIRMHLIAQEEKSPVNK